MNYVDYIREFVGKNPIILVGAVVIVMNENNEILLQQRKSTSYGSWGLPGGLMELKESTEAAARREVFEETGLILGELTLEEVLSGEGCYLKVPNGDEFYSVTIAYSTGEYEGEMLVDDEESLAVEFYPLESLPERMVGSHKHIILNFIKKLKIYD